MAICWAIAEAPRLAAACPPFDSPRLDRGVCLSAFSKTEAWPPRLNRGEPAFGGALGNR